MRADYKSARAENKGFYGKEGPEGTEKHNDRGEKKANTIRELFSNNKINPVGKDGVPEYTQGFIIPTTLEQDKIMRASALSEINKDYNLILSNCAQTVQNALCSVGLSPGNGIVPRYQVYPSIVVKNKGEIFLYYDTRNKQYSRGAK